MTDVIVFLSLAISFTFPGLAQAAEPTIHLSSTLRCEQALTAAADGGNPYAFALRKILNDGLPETVDEAHAGVFRDLRALLQAAGASRPTALVTTGITESLVAAYKDENSPLGRTAAYLRAHEQDAKSLIFCFVNASCVPEENSGIDLMPAAGDVHFAVFHDSGEIERVPLARHAGPSKYIVLSDIDSALVSGDWVAELFGVTARLVPYEVLLDWVAANAANLKKNIDPDELFSTYVRIGPDQQFEVDAGFVEMLIETQSLAAEHGVLAHLRTRYDEFPSADEYVAQYVEQNLEWSDALSRKLNLDPEDALELSERWLRTMKQTIARSR